MSFFDELRNDFYNERNPLVKKLRDQIRIISFSGTSTSIYLNGATYNFLLNMNNTDITKFLSTVFETDDITYTSSYSERFKSSVVWHRIVDSDSGYTKEIAVYWRV